LARNDAASRHIAAVVFWQLADCADLPAVDCRRFRGVDSRDFLGVVIGEVVYSAGFRAV
jgi:hypothetical protein